MKRTSSRPAWPSSAPAGRLTVKDGKIAVTKTPNGENPLVHGGKPILGCDVGAFLLHRLSQPAAGLSQGVHGSSGQLGIRRQDVRRRDEVLHAAMLDVALRHSGRDLPQQKLRPVALARRFPPRPGTDQNRVFDWLAVAVLGIVAVVALATFRDYGLSWDDYAHSEYGDLLVAFYASGFADQRALSWIIYRYGGGFDLLAALAAKALPFTVFETRRLLGAASRRARIVRHLAGRPPHRRTAGRADRAHPARDRRSITATCS